MTVLFIVVAWLFVATALSMVAGPVVAHRPVSPDAGVWIVVALIVTYLAALVGCTTHQPAPATRSVTPATAAPAVPFQP